MSSADQAEVDAFDECIELFANYEMAAGGAVKQLLFDYPSSAMGTVLRGYMTLMLETSAVQQKVASMASDAIDGSTELVERERLHLQALSQWAGGDVIGAAVMWDRLLATNPTDLLALKVHHYTTFWTGRANVLLSAVEGVLDAWGEDTPGYDHVLGMYSFGLNETGRHLEAERVARRAVALNPEDLWSVHAVAHALEMQGDLAAGIDFFDVDTSIWESKNPFVGHIWWHAALFPWNKGQYDRVLAIYDDRLRPASTDFFLDIQNLTSLLARLELVGVDVGDRWNEIAEYAAARIGDHVLTFTDAHCALALARTNRFDDLEALAESLLQHRETRPVTVDRTPIDLAIQLTHFFGAGLRGDHQMAMAAMGLIRGDLAAIGGSHAQRDLFDLLHLESAMAANDLAVALNLCSVRRHRWPNSVPTWSKYAEVLDAVGHHDRALNAAQRAKEVAS
jgi:tetratricopeptide (TPR) repeat protein